MSLEQLLDRPIAFHRSYVTLVGSVTGALFLSQAVYWQFRSKSDDGWWWKTVEDWQAETGMARRELENAREACSKLIKWERRGIPAKTFYRVDLDALMAALGDKQVRTKDTNWTEPKIPTGSADTSELLSTETTSEITTETTRAKRESDGVEIVYQNYPLKVGKPAALKKISKAILKFGLEHVLARTQKFNTLWSGSSKEDREFCPNPATWFHQERFNDDPATWRGPKSKTIGGEKAEVQEGLKLKEAKF